VYLRLNKYILILIYFRCYNYYNVDASVIESSHFKYIICKYTYYVYYIQIKQIYKNDTFLKTLNCLIIIFIYSISDNVKLSNNKMFDTKNEYINFIPNCNITEWENIILYYFLSTYLFLLTINYFLRKYLHLMLKSRSSLIK
jgi:hypothetical protein